MDSDLPSAHSWLADSPDISSRQCFEYSLMNMRQHLTIQLQNACRMFDFKCMLLLQMSPKISFTSRLN